MIYLPDMGSSTIDDAYVEHCIIVDQRDFIRPTGAGWDIGSMEVGSSVVLDVISKMVLKTTLKSDSYRRSPDARLYRQLGICICWLIKPDNLLPCGFSFTGFGSVA